MAVQWSIEAESRVRKNQVAHLRRTDVDQRTCHARSLAEAELEDVPGGRHERARWLRVESRDARRKDTGAAHRRGGG